MKKRLCICLMFVSLIIGLIPTQTDTVFAQDDKSECMLLEECKSDVHSLDCPMYKDSVASKGMSDDNSWEECDDCSKDQPHMISTTSDLDKVRTHKHTKDGVTIITGYFKLANDIVFKDEDFEKDGDFYNNGWGWAPIGTKKMTGYGTILKFHGDFNGNKNVIKNLKINRPAGYWYNGLFAGPDGNAHIYDLVLEDFDITGDGSGVLCGQFYSKNVVVENIKLLNCKVTGLMSAAKTSAILVGEMSGGTIRNVEINSCSYSRQGVTWYGSFITNHTGSDALLENITISNCDLTVYAHGGILVANLGDRAILKNIKVQNSKITSTHSSFYYLFGQYSKTSQSVDSSISDVFIDVELDGTLNGKMTICKPENKVNPFIHNVYIHAKHKTGTVETRIENNTLYISQNLPEKTAGKLTPTSSQYSLYANGAIFSEDTKFDENGLTSPIKEGSIFEGWYEDKDFKGDPVDKVETEKTYYAKWTGIEPLEVEYKDTDQIKVTGEVTELKNWKSDNENIATVDAHGHVKGINVGTAKISVTGTYNGQSMSFTTTVTVRPINIIYGSANNQQDGRPYVVYSLKENGKAPLISDILGFYPTIRQSDGTYKADTSKERIILNPGMGNTGDVEYTYIDSASGNKVTTGSLPLHPTLNEKGEPHSIRVEMKIKNPNYRFTTVGTNWKPGDTIVLFVTCHEEGMNEVDMYLKGEDSPLETFENRREYEYTGEGIIPTSKDLTSLYTKGKNTIYTITKFTAHFHAVEEGTKFDGTHLTTENSGLTKDALKAIAPKEMGVYSFVVNGYNRDTKTYCYASRRYRIVKGKPKGEPKIQCRHSEITLSEIELTGIMENAAGKEVEGKFVWNEPETKVKEGTKYTWTFIPEDEEHYETVEGEIVVRHLLEVVERKEASCSEEGQRESFYCKECDKYFRDDKGLEEITKEEVMIKATGHKYGEWVVTKEATKEELGRREKICERCGEKVEEEIPAIKIDVIAPEEKDNQTTAKPKTEDSSNILIYVFIGGLAIAGIMIVVLNKKREEML